MCMMGSNEDDVRVVTVFRSSDGGGGVGGMDFFMGEHQGGFKVLCGQDNRTQVISRAKTRIWICHRTNQWY